jgi:hypothetical protein
MIRALEEPCWVAGSDDGEHYAGEDAADGAGIPPGTARELPYRCLVAECDGGGCGEPFSDEEYPVTHFEPGDTGIGSYLRDFEWRVTADGRVFCGDEPEPGDAADGQDHQQRGEAL